MNWLIYIGGGWLWLILVGGFFNTVIKNNKEDMGFIMKWTTFIGVELIWIWVCWRFIR